MNLILGCILKSFHDILYTISFSVLVFFTIRYPLYAKRYICPEVLLNRCLRSFF